MKKKLLSQVDNPSPVLVFSSKEGSNESSRESSLSPGVSEDHTHPPGDEEPQNENPEKPKPTTPS